MEVWMCLLDVVREDGLRVEVEKRIMCGGCRVEPWFGAVGRGSMGEMWEMIGEMGDVGWPLCYLHAENLFLKCVTCIDHLF